MQIPVVPDKPGVVNGSRSGEQTEGRGGGGGGGPESPTYVGGGEADLLPMASWSGQASTNPPWAQQQQHFVSEVAAAAAGREGPGEQGSAEDAAEGNMLLAIRKGVKLKRTLTNDRSAPRIA